MDILETKSGDTFQFTGQLSIDGNVQILNDTVIKCYLRTKNQDKLAAQCTVTKLDSTDVLDPPGTKKSFTCTLAPVTTASLRGNYVGDIEYTFLDGTKTTTPSFEVSFNKKETREDPP